ncbi:hypothetical protein [Streptomyces sp. FH025]|uniref:hypothetical protein n=1 Tax=Streptomyces sp. FH025 TaxID=2815937 RepID=UPI001A9F1845|nr:hypothetical protein [Streptomyces sp. FH025]MBO1418962.1 hypothetical protein [Streptomyces sp. FH025]
MTVDAGEQGHPFGLGDLRALLAGDVLARTCEAQGPQVFTELAVPDGPDEQVRALLKAADRLGIRPPARLSARREPDGADPTTADLVITGRPPRHPGAWSTALLATGPVTEEPSNAGPDPLIPFPASERDPRALRLVLLEHAVTAPVRLTAAALTDAAARLARWRALVADLARAPSGPLDTDTVRASFDGLNEDLDARVALGALEVLEDRADLPEGARFETYVHLDQVLALELERDIGRGPG